MKFFNAVSALGLTIQVATATFTEVLDVTQVIHRDAFVMVDDNGVPWTTSYKEATSWYTASAAAGTSNTATINAIVAPSSTPVHSSSAVVSLSTTTNEYTTVTLTRTVTLGSSSATHSATHSATSSAAVTSKTTPTKETSSSFSAPAASSSVPAPTTSATAETSKTAPVKETSSSYSAPVASSSVAAPTGSVFSGQGTYYSVGLGACGWTNQDQDMVVALNAAQFGSQSNGNPVCGNRIILTGPKGNSITVTVVDKCPECAHGSLDLSPSAFQQLASLDDGRINIHWYFA